MVGGTIRRLLVALAMLLAASPAAAQGGSATRLAACVARATPGMTPQRLFVEPAAFDCATPQTDWGYGDYWVLAARFAPPPAGEAVRVRVASVWQTRATLHALYADGVQRAVTLDGQGASRHLQLGATVEIVLPARAAPLRGLLWHVEGAANVRGIVIGAQLADATHAAASNLEMAAIYAAFGGLALALLVQNLALWRALRHRFLLAYCAMVACLMVYALSSSGALSWVVPIANNDRIRLNYAMIGLAATSALAFARTFFEPRVVEGWLRRLGDAVALGILGTTAAFVALAPWKIRLLDRLVSISIVALLLFAVPLLWRAWRRRSNDLWMFAIAWAAPIAVTAARVLASLDILPWTFWLEQSTLLAMATEALLSSLAIAYRLRLLTAERDDLRTREVAARLLADTDPLTGLANRRAFLRQAIGRTGDQTLLILDIDHFKDVNETIGHDGGDEVLRLIARTLRQSLSPTALVARLGGEEFAVISPAETAPDPDMILARLRAARMPFDLSVTASIGACTGPIADERDWKALYRAADRALFEAKAAGRDRTRRGVALAA